METKVYKTKSYTLKAVKAYYERNKERIMKKNTFKRFEKKANELLTKMEDPDITEYNKWVLLFQLTNYKIYQTSLENRNIIKERLLKIVQSMDTLDNDMSFLRLGNEYGDENDISYDGNY